MAMADKITVLPTQTAAPARPSFLPHARAPKLRKRHIALILAFVALVLLPVLVSAWYLWQRAEDQYASDLAFSVRSEEPTTGLEMLGGIADMSGSGANDSDILYDYLHSQHLVEELEQSLNLSSMWTGSEKDPIFSFRSSGQIEDLHDHWRRMVHVTHDSGRGILEIRTRAFTPEDATAINDAILAASTELINQINNVARDDSVRYALDDLQRSKAQLSEARRALTEFRVKNEIVDPALDASIQTNLLATLDAQLTEVLIEIEILSQNTRSNDIRLDQAQTRAQVLRNRIQEERANRALPLSTSERSGTAALFSEYERLLVDVEFAEQRYLASRASFDAALSDARRNTRYLAAHILPTQAQKSLYPDRGLIVSLIFAGAFLIWSVLSLIGFSFLDRR